MQHHLIHSDCFDYMQGMSSKCVDMILTDLPYEQTARNEWDKQIPFDKMWERFNYIIKDNGAIVLTATQPFASRLVCSNLDMFKYHWVWVKSNKTNFLNAKKQPLRQHEQVLVFYKKQPIYNPQGIVKVDKITRQGLTETTNYGRQKRGAYLQENEGYPTDILHIASPPQATILHPTQKPVDLFAYLIKTYTNEGDLVFDPCAGVATTMVAAHNAGRWSICIEKDVSFYQKALGRIKDASIPATTTNINTPPPT